MSHRQTNNVEEYQTDIAIIGAGGAGLAAAVAATERGAKTLLLEKLNAPGGNSKRAESFFAAESRAQQRVMVDAPKDVLFRMAMDYAHWKINPRIVRAFVDKSGDTVRWLEEKGLVIDWISPYYPNQVIRTEHQAKKGGADVVKVLLKACKELGVMLICKTAARKILTNERGEITGILATTVKKKELNITSRCVVISTGGYAANKELLRKYCPWYSEEILYRGLPHMGDGLIMATEIGAATEGLGMLQMSGPHFDGSRYRAGIVVQQPNTIWVNKKGERFIDESIGFNHFESVNALIRQPSKVSYTVFDDQIKRNIMEKGPIKMRQGVLYGQKKTAVAELDNDFKLEAEKQTVKISGSWDEIAIWIGASRKTLKATIEEYNHFCDRGHDDIFVKDRRFLEPLRTPPYYAMRCHPGVTTTIGGIKINHHMEVLNKEDNPIPGLYAAGNDTGGWESDTYNVHLSGSTFGFALNSGRIAGENAAQYVLSP